ncbi:peptidase M23 [Cellulophaga sp. BC115SP]|uniref:peptidase M23 n=1 Tax=Cellulophaga sp. BC115SP TaxID=2683263 RepID=UPI0014123C64|nr:peptidase M23 [Cellulophaga sp. BC115SP]NBB29540.1 peptidase M23 [Cellulophaga sp. BC115SP]
MKTFFLTYILLGGCGLTTVSSCNSPIKKVDHAKAAVMEADSNLIKANQEYLKEVAQYKQETAEKIAMNDKSIAEFKARVALEKKSAKKDYLLKIEKLEKKNSDLKKRMDEFRADNKKNWKAFKKEFNHDMDEIGKAFKDLTVKNVKIPKE